MKRIFQSYGILSLSLVTLFTSGVFIGRMTTPQPPPAVKTAADLAAEPDAWMAAASRGLVRDLKLDATQQEHLRDRLEPVATAIFADRERALFQMHLRLLELHDQLAKEPSMHDSQLRHLASSRVKLKELIIARFPNMVRQNPTLAIQP